MSSHHPSGSISVYNERRFADFMVVYKILHLARMQSISESPYRHSQGIDRHLYPGIPEAHLVRSVLTPAAMA
jgi:hypothetical protein